MRRRIFKAVLGLFAVLLIAGPVAADDFTGAEEDEQTLDCPAEGESVPATQEPPGEGECDDEEETTYQGYVWDNDVTCAEGGTDAQAANIYTTNSGTNSGAVGVCNDGSPAPIQGRAAVSGSMSDGITVYVDGDKDNSPEQAHGWLRVNVGTGGPSVTCGDANGKRDVTHADENDGQDDCG